MTNPAPDAIANGKISLIDKCSNCGFVRGYHHFVAPFKCPVSPQSDEWRDTHFQDARALPPETATPPTENAAAGEAKPVLWPPCNYLSNTGNLHPSAKPPCNGNRCVLCAPEGSLPATPANAGEQAELYRQVEEIKAEQRPRIDADCGKPSDQLATAGEAKQSLRIYTRCPACKNDTLTIGEDKHLLCTWIDCPDPCLIDRADDPKLRASLSRANVSEGAEVKEAIRVLAIQLWQDARAGKQDQLVCHLTDAIDDALAAERQKVETAERKRDEAIFERDRSREARDANAQLLNTVLRQRNEARQEFEKARQWNELTELEITNLRSLQADAESDLTQARAEVETAKRLLNAQESELRKHGVSTDCVAVIGEPMPPKELELRRELEQARRERERAIAEANRRDQKWMVGLDEIFGPNDWSAGLSDQFPNTPQQKWQRVNREVEKLTAELADTKASLAIVTKERDDLKFTYDRNRKGMDMGQDLLDAGRWAGFPIVEGLAVELTEARAEAGKLTAEIANPRILTDEEWERIEAVNTENAHLKAKLAAAEQKLAETLDTFAKHQRATVDSRNQLAINDATKAVEIADLKQKLAASETALWTVRDAAQKLLQACESADERGELDSSISGDLMFSARKALSAPAPLVQPEGEK